MKPELLKTMQLCRVAALAIYEARVVVSRHSTDENLDAELWLLEKTFWKRADAVQRARARATKKAKGRKR